MDLYAFFNTFSSALASDDALQTWGVSNFGRQVMVLPNAESANLPTVESMPYVLLASPGFTRSQLSLDQEYVIAAWLALTCTEMKPGTGGNVREPEGVRLISEMIELVLNAFKGALPDGFQIREVVGDSDTLGMLPEVHGAVVFTFTYYGTMGNDPLT
ncbi:hypothetical protein [Desulfatitalea tepidiphila]|uniref:hypothetical protein n=1 Tax=Desulfatitalea tepidiphila TaxID=1185843 RepID=UPI0006B41326|nr:hypothetical protein [Desulfatitalea tepidiphila]